MISIDVKVTVGLCVKDSRDIVHTAIQSISIQDYPHEALKLVIVDEEKDEQALSELMNLALQTDIRTAVLSSQGKGLGAARQLVVDNAEGEYIVWVDDDFVLKQDFISRQVEFMDKNLTVGAARAKELVYRINLLTTLDAYLRVLNEPDMDAEPVGDYLIFRLKAIRQVGGFDVKIKGATEDLDISQRIFHSGWKLSTNYSALLYKKNGPKTWGALWRKHYWYGYGAHFFLHKYKRCKKRLDLLPLFALGVGVRDSFKIYRLNHEKKAFALGLYYFYKNAANCFGYVNAHLDGYGHTAND